MGATRIEFRLRMVVMAIIIALGFFAPWIEPLERRYAHPAAGVAGARTQPAGFFSFSRRRAAGHRPGRADCRQGNGLSRFGARPISDPRR